MPSTMGNPYPREFVNEGDRIVLRIEEHDNVRVIHMTDAVEPATQPASRLGYSAGRWEDERTLVVSTTSINFPWYNTTGVPQSEDVTVHERFTLSDDELRLYYEQVVDGSATFTASARLTGEWTGDSGYRDTAFRYGLFRQRLSLERLRRLGQNGSVEHFPHLQLMAVKTRDSRARRKVRRPPGRSAYGWRAR